MQVGIIGAGALGMMAAWTLARAGHRVTVIEREDAVGGLAVNFTIGGTALERYYHHVFRTDKRIIRLIAELGLGDRLLWGSPPTALRTHGGSYRFDSPISVLRFPWLPPLDRLRTGLLVGYLKLVPSPDRFEGTTAAAWLPRMMGQASYKVVWEPQLRSKFGDLADQVAMPWFWARVHDRTPQLGYLKGGFGSIYERLADRIRKLGGLVRTGEGVERITRDDRGPVLQTSLGTERFDQVIVTLPTALFLRLAPDLPAAYREKYRQASPHLGAHNAVLGLDRQVQWTYWLSLCDPGYPFLALVEHTNFLPASDYSGLHVMYLGNYLPQDDRLFSLTDEETLAEIVPGLKRIRPDFDVSWIKEAAINRAPFAQPVVTKGYRDRQPPFETPWPDVWLANMGQVYPHDRGQNYSLILGEDVAAKVLAAAPAAAPPVV